MSVQHSLEEAVSKGCGFKNIAASCPYCNAAKVAWEEMTHSNTAPYKSFLIANENSPFTTVIAGRCTICNKVAIAVQRISRFCPPGTNSFGVEPGVTQYSTVLLYPKSMLPDRAPNGLNAEAKQDYDEARAVMGVSPQAAATLARRCLQYVLTTELEIPNETAKGSFRPLIQIIDDARKSDRLSTRVKDALQDIREIGNIGAHPEIDLANTLIRVSEDEALYTIEVLEWLFDELYVHSERSQQMKQRIEEIKKKTGRSKPQ